MSKLNKYLLKLFLSITLLGLVFYLITQNEAFATEWQKYPENPIFRENLSGWDSYHVLNPSVLSINGVYKLWYQGNGGFGYRIGYAYSNDGLSKWNRTSTPVISPESIGGWEKETAEPYVLYNSESTTYKMFFTSINPDHWTVGKDRFRLRTATTSSNLEWIKDINWSLYGTEGSWDSGGIYKGKSIIYQNGVYHLWYGGTNESPLGPNAYWRIGYATSTDSAHWKKENLGNPVIEPTKTEPRNSSYPTVLFSGGLFHMWYGAGNGDDPTQINYAYSKDGIVWVKPDELNPAILGTPGTFDQYVAPHTILKEDNILKLWYSGLGSDVHWRIGYATASASILPTPDPDTVPTASPVPTITSTPTPTPSPTVTPTPTPLPKKVVIIPGLGGSWNTGALLSCSLDNSPYNGWEITPIFGTSVYEPLYNDLQLKGFQPYYFAYDWRKNVQDNNQALTSFLNTIATDNEKLIGVGHSMGGLVGKSYLLTTSELSNKLDKLLMVGSPHDGAVAAYPVWSAGEIWTDDLRIRIAMTFVIETCGKLHNKTNRDMVRELMPSFGNLLPRFPYLIDSKSNSYKIPVDAQNTLPNMPVTNPYSGTKLQTVSGKGSETLSSLTVKDPSWGDLKYPNWIDGKPVQKGTSTDGDNTVTVDSATLVNIPDISIAADHSGLIKSFAGISAIENFIGATGSASVNNVENPEEQSALMIVAYPSSILVTDPGWTIHKGNQSMVGFLNPKNGIYRLLVIPESDTTRLIVAQFLPNNRTLWKEYTLTGKLPKIHAVTFDAGNPKEDILQ